MNCLEFKDQKLPKDQIQPKDIAKRTKAAVIGLSKSKLYSTVLDPEIYVENYEILRFDRNWFRGGVT